MTLKFKDPFYQPRQMVHLHNRCNLASQSVQSHWPLVAPISTGTAVFFFYVAGQKDPPPLGSRFLEAWRPVGRALGTLPSQVSIRAQAGCRLLCGRVSREPLTALKCLSRACGEGALRRTTFCFPGLGPDSAAFKGEIHNLPPHHPPAF